MASGDIVLMLVYEPPTTKRGPIPLVRVDNPDLALRVAQSAIADAEARASELSRADEFLGEAERAEAQRLRRVLALVNPWRGCDRAADTAGSPVEPFRGTFRNHPINPLFRSKSKCHTSISPL
jgi:hypothetical protein